MRVSAWLWIVGILFLVGTGYLSFAKKSKTEIPTLVTLPQKSMTLTITSPAFEMNGIIPARFTCDDKDISPELIFSNIPTSAQSLALTSLSMVMAVEKRV